MIIILSLNDSRERPATQRDSQAVKARDFDSRMHRFKSCSLCQNPKLTCAKGRSPHSGYCLLSAGPNPEGRGAAHYPSNKGLRSGHDPWCATRGLPVPQTGRHGKVSIAVLHWFAKPFHDCSWRGFESLSFRQQRELHMRPSVQGLTRFVPFPAHRKKGDTTFGGQP